MEKPRLTIASDFSYPSFGGTERHVMDTAQYYSKRFQVSIVSPNWGSNSLSLIQINDIVVYKFPAKGRNRFIRILRYMYYVADRQPDIVIAHYFLPAISMLLLNLFGIKVYPVIHELENVHSPTAFFLNAFDKIFVRTHMLKNKCITLGINKSKLIVTHHEINPMFRKLKLKKIYDVIIVSRINSGKGADNYIEVINENPELKFCWVGGYMPEERDAYEHKINNCKNLTYQGFVSDDKLIQLYNQSRIYLSCSKKEGFGITATEAMACGLPVIASGAGGLMESVGKYGIITQDYSKAIVSLLSNKKEYKKYQALSAIRAHQLSFDKIINIYDNVLNGVF